MLASTFLLNCTTKPWQQSFSLHVRQVFTNSHFA